MQLSELTNHAALERAMWFCCCNYQGNKEVCSYLSAFLCTSWKCLFPNVTHFSGPFNQLDTKLLLLLIDSQMLQRQKHPLNTSQYIKQMVPFQYSYLQMPNLLLLLASFYSFIKGLFNSLSFNTIFWANIKSLHRKLGISKSVELRRVNISKMIFLNEWL